MDKKYLRQKYIDMLTLHVTKGVPASIENDQFQDEICKFEADPEYRLKLNTISLNIFDYLIASEKLSLEETRWLRDTWLY